MKNNKGFTVVELIITLALLLVVLAIGYQLIYYAQSNYDRTSNYWERQNKVIALSTYIEETIDNANYMEVISSVSESYDPSMISNEFESVIFTNDDTFRIMTNDVNNVDIVLTDFRNEEFENIDVIFNRVLQEDGATNYPNLLEVVITATDINFTLATKIKIENIGEGSSIIGGSGDIIIFMNP